jgi:hypothetical protein
MVQDVKRISLSSIVEAEGKILKKGRHNHRIELYSEPSPYAVVGHLERSMMSIALRRLY